MLGFVLQCATEIALMLLTVEGLAVMFGKVISFIIAAILVTSHAVIVTTRAIDWHGKNNGYTLIELMIALAITGICLCVLIPNILRFFY